MTPTIDEQIERLKKTIAEMEAQRDGLGEKVVQKALEPLYEKLGELNRQLEASRTGFAEKPLQQRKLVTILFMDIVGSTAIIQHMDPEDVSEIFDHNLKRLTQPVEELGGRVTSFTGDGFMAIFGASTAQENDPERAARAGLAILEFSHVIADELKKEWGIHDFKVRVGVNTGLVLLGGETEGEDTTKGPAVHLAARLQSAAPAGGMLISHDTYRHIRGVFDVEQWEPLILKGFDEPVQVYRVLGAKPRTFRLYTRGVEGVETRMVGRQPELQYLQEALHSALEGGEGQMITIIGEAGVGKSRLLYEFQDWIELLPPPGISIMEGRGRQEAQGLPYGLLRNMFSLRFQLQENDTQEAMFDKVESGFLEVFGNGDEAQMRAHILARWLGFDFDASQHLQGVLNDGERLRNLGLTYLVEYLRKMCNQRPAVVFLEDIHWADDSSLEMLNRLVEYFQSRPLLFVCTARHTLLESRPDWGEGMDNHHRLDLEPLSRQESQQLVMEILKLVENLPAELTNLVVDGAEGNPFYMEELIKMLVEDRVVVKGEEKWQVKQERLLEIKIPPTLAGVLQARLESLPADELLVIQQASVIGRLFWDQVVEHIQAAENGRPQFVPEVLVSLRSREMVYRRETSTFMDAREYLFKHDILREVTYESVLKRLRRRYHGLVADWLIAHTTERTAEFSGLIAVHLERSGQTGRAVPYLHQAGDQAVSQYATKEAVEYYQRALGLIAQQPAGEKIIDELPIQIHEDLGDIYLTTGQYDQARDAFQMAFDLIAVQDCLLRARLKRKLARACQDQGKHEIAFREFMEAETILGDLTSTSAPAWWQEWIRIQIDQLSGYYALARTEKIAELINRVQPVIEQYGTLYQHADFYSGQARMYFRRDRYIVSDELLDNSRKLLSIAHEIGDRHRIGEAHFELGFTLLWHEDYHEAESELLQALELGEKCSDLYSQTLSLTYLGICSRLMGRVDETQAYVSRSTQVASERKMFNYVATARANQAWVALRQGDLVEAESNANAALDLWRQYSQFHYPFQWTALWPLIAIAVEREQLDQAAAYTKDMLKPDQQCLPGEITAALESAVTSFGNHQLEAAIQGFKEALVLAQKSGYL